MIRTKNRRSNKGFTLIELLVVVLILAILMAVALPLYLNAIADANKKTCRANMQTIANAEQAYKVSSSGHAFAGTMDALVAAGDLGAAPQCPLSGTYTLDTTSGLKITCSVAAHGSFTPGVDKE